MTIPLAELLARATAEVCANGATPASRCEPRSRSIARAGDWLASLERRLEEGDARGVLRRLGAWVASDARPLGERGVALVARASRAIGRDDVARAHALSIGGLGLDHELATRPAPDWVVSEDGSRIEIDGRVVSLARRPCLRKILLVLLDHPDGIESRALFASVWTERRATLRLVHNRVDVSLARLRALGFGDRIVRREGRILLSRREEER